MKPWIRMVVMAVMSQLLASSAAAGTYLMSSDVDTYVSIEDNSHMSFSILADGGATATGRIIGSAYYNNTYSAGSLNRLPLPLFPGVYTTSQTSGGTDPGTPGSAVNSTSGEISRIFIFSDSFASTYFNVGTTLTMSVQPTSASENMNVDGSVTMVFNGATVYSTSATISTPNTGLGNTSTVTDTSPNIFLELLPGLNEFDAIVSASGRSTVNAAAVPEPGSLVLGCIGVILAGTYVASRRGRSRWLAS